MNTEYGMYAGYNVESKSMESSVTSKAVEMDGPGCCNMGCSNPGVVCPPVYECPKERCVHREFVHEVPHVCPVNTRIINHHVYRHTYSPCYTCCEENVVSNINPGCCNTF